MTMVNSGLKGLIKILYLHIGDTTTYANRTLNMTILTGNIFSYGDSKDIVNHREQYSYYKIKAVAYY